MGANKQALLRYRIIDKCLMQRDRRWNWKALADHCSQEMATLTGEEMQFSERTIKGDIAEMRHNPILGYFAPIEYNRQTKSYEYVQPGYKLAQSTISKKDRNELQQALAVMRQFGALNSLQGIQSALTKIQQTLDQEESPTQQQVLLFDHPSETRGQQWLQVLYELICQKTCINLMYEPFGKKMASYRISPYLLKEYKYRWYLIGFSHKDNELRVYGLDRVVDIQTSLSPYVPSTDSNLHKFFDPVIGVTLHKNQKSQEIIFEVHAELEVYLLTSPLHASQRHVATKDHSWTRFTLAVIPNYELIRELLSYGAKVRVISPQEVVQSMRSHAQEMNGYYNKA